MARGLLVVVLAVSAATCRIGDIIGKPQGALLFVDPKKPDSLRDSSAFGSTAPRRDTIRIENRGDGELKWSARLKNGSPWVTLDPDTGTAGTTPTLGVRFDPSGLDSGVYEDTVIVSAVSGTASDEVPLWFNVHPCRTTGISLDNTVSTTLTSADCAAPHRPVGRFAKLYTFSGTVNDSVSVEVTAAFDAYVAIDTSLAANRPPLVQDDNCLGTAVNPCIYYTRLPFNATYFVEVTSADSGDTGAFTVSVLHPRLPTVPAALDQRLTDSVTSVAVGSTVNATSLLLRATVSDPDLPDLLHLEAEVRPTNVAFSGPNVPNGPTVSNGQVAWVSTGTLSDKTAYHWRVRVGDNTGRTGPWDSLPGNADFTINIPHPPDAPASLAQSKPDGTPINVGGVADTDVVVFSASISDQDPGDQLRLQVEVQPIGTAFLNLPTDSSTAIAGGIAQVRILNGNNTNYHWQARVTDQSGLASGWLSFGNNTESQTDFRIQLANVPNAPTALLQFQSDGTTSLPLGGVTAAQSVVLKANVSDPDVGQSVQLEVEVKPTTVAFINQPNYSSTSVTNPAQASVPVGPLTNNTSYHWQARVKDATNRTGAWVSFPDPTPNPETAADFSVQTPPTELFFSVQPPLSTTAGTAMAPAIVVQARDINHNVSLGFTGNVVMTLEPNPGGATLSGTTTVAAVGGVATFSNLIVTKAGSGYVLRATTAIPSLTQTSTTFSINPAATTQLVFTVNPPASTQAGVAMSPAVSVTAEDNFLNPTPSYATQITLSIANNAGSPTPGTLTGGGPVTPINGVASFPGVSIDKVGNGYTIRAVSGTLTPDTSTAFNITPGPATHLAYTVQPTKAPSASPITPAVTVRALDANNNRATAFASGVTLTITAGTGTAGAAISNGGPVNAVSGDASFPNASINLVGPGYRLDANAAGLTKATSDTFSIINSPISNTLSTVVASPTTITASSGSITSTITVTALDGSGQPVQGVSVTLSASPSPGVTVNQPSALTNASGVTTGTISSDSAGPKVITVVAGGVTLTQTPTVTVNPAAPSVLVFTNQPGTTTAGAAINSGSGGVVVTARDQFGNTASFTSIVQMTIAAPVGGTFAPTSTNSVTAVGGVAMFNNLRIYKSGGGYQLKASGGTLTALSSTFTINTAPSVKLAFTTQPTNTAVLAKINDPTGVVVTVQDSVGNTTPFGGTVRINLGTDGAPGGGSTLSGGGAITAPTGVATFPNLTINKVGTGFTLLAATTTSGVGGDESTPFNIVTGPPTKLAFTTTPSSSAQSGVAFAQQPVIQIQDANGFPVSQGGTVITATFASGTGTLANATATTNASGAATFVGLAITGLAGNYTLSFGTPGLTSVTSGTIALSSGAPTQLVIGQQPSASAQSGVAFAQQPTVQLRDGSGNAVSQANVTITATIATGPGGGSLTNSTALTNASGLATFSGLAITGTVGTYTLRFGSGSLTPDTSTAIVLSAGAATQLVIGTQPSASAQNGVAFAQQPTVQLRDGGGNAVSQANVTVTATIATGPGGGSPTNSTALTNASGLATFSGLAITGTVGSYTLRFGSGSLTPDTSTAIALSAGVATKLGITTQPSTSAQSGVAFAQQPVIQIQDASGNAVSQNGTLITATITTKPGGNPSLTSNTATTNASGAATFSGLAITGLTGNYALTFSANPLASVVSGTIALSAGGATQLLISTQPSATAQNGVALAQQPAVQLQDAGGNPVSQANVTITATIATTPGGGSLANATALTNASGLATFSGLAITGTAGSYTLRFGSGSLTPDTSTAIALSAGAATQLVIGTQPSASAQNGVAFAQQPTVQLRDGGGNAVSQANVTVTATIATGPGGGSLTNSTALTNASGLATFSGLAITGTVGSYTLRFGSGSLTPDTSTAIALSAGVATKLGITTQPSISAQSGVAFAQQPVIQIQDASGNAVSQNGTLITATIATNPGGSPSLSSATATTNASGAATFAGLAINGLVGTYTLDFIGGGLTKATSNAITLTTGPATNLVITAQPTNTVAGAAISPAIQVVVKDAGGNTVTSPRTDITMTIGTNPGSGTLSGTTTVRTGVGTGTSLFSDLSINKAAPGYTLVASATGLPSTTSSTFAITPAAAAVLVFTQEPSDGPANTAMSPAVVVTVQDQFGNTANFNGTVTLTVVGGGSGITGNSVSAVSGVATFSNLILDTPGTYTLNADGGGLPTVQSTSFTIS